ncbi:riboflavin synthase [Corynebacterium uterequi]|uniref:Riboflavin synthase n=1 Tax=Corynebacterium uterequi TaxID=1072256 RepID=A0A0G3HJ91_9CORY|nr:riboflavin synthase [Corynebacterium uterequi]AKK11172.1 riboflavin synthase alpha chain [Corynebacterium uterequi]
MFTGLVEEIGTVAALEPLADAIRLRIAAARVIEGVSAGDSISVNGVCLTVTDYDDAGFAADVMQESLNRSSLGALEVGSPVNLERAVAVGDRLGGHIVQGHVDGTAQVVSRQPSEHWEVVRVGLPADLRRYVVTKGSIAVNGTSLTVSAVGPDFFEVSLIPATLRDTTLGAVDVGETVNLEVDIVAKYVENMVTAPGA